MDGTVPTVKTTSGSETSPAGRAAGVEAIFLSPADPEGGSSGGKSKELWRHAQDEAGSLSARNQKAESSLSTSSKEVKSSADQTATKKPKHSAQEHGDKVSNKHAGRTPVASTEPLSSSSTSSGKPLKQKHRGPTILEENGRPPILRKSRSVTDIDGERDSQTSSTPSTARGRRMSISVAHYSMASSSHDSSRRSSAASIVISVSRPDSPVPHILQRPDNQSYEDTSLEFLRIRRTAAAVHMITRFKHTPTTSNTLMPEVPRMTNEETAENLIRIHKERRNSMPAIPRLNLKGESESGGSPGDESLIDQRQRDKKESNKRPPDPGRRRGRRRRSSTGSSIMGYYMPASRPSSAMAGAAAIEMSRPSSSATIVQLGKLSRPWTPARSPSPISNESGGNRWGAGSRNFFRSRTPASMAAPLQALNQKVNNLLGCASNILDFYNLRPDLKKEQDPQRQARLLKSKKMNEKKSDEQTSQSRLLKFRKNTVTNLIPLEKIKDAVTPVNKREYPLQIIKQQQIIQHSPMTNQKRSIKKRQVEKPSKLPALQQHPPGKELISKISNLSVPTVASSTSTSSTKSKGIAILKSMMANRTSAAAASAFTGKALPLPAKVRMNKVLKMTKQHRPMRSRSSQNKSNQSAPITNSNQGPPTLVNFFKRANRSNADTRAPIKYETFTDKDRAAAVLLGDADIKTTLEKQLKSGTCPIRAIGSHCYRLIFNLIFFLTKNKREGPLRVAQRESGSSLSCSSGFRDENRWIGHRKVFTQQGSGVFHVSKNNEITF